MDDRHAGVGCLGIAMVGLASVAASVAVGLNHGAWAGWATMAVCLALMALWLIAAALGR